MKKRNFLLLQGICSPFFARLAQQLRQAGHTVYKVNFNAGDSLYWGGQAAWHYRGKAAELGDFLADKYQRYGITDQVLFGDRRPVHQPAVALAAQCGVRTHVFEEGYFRPYWLTLERDGVNAHSLLPRDPDWYWAVGGELPEYGDGAPFRSQFSIRTVHDVAYHVAGLWNPLFYPGYQTHAPVTAPVEYAGYLRRFAQLEWQKKRDAARIAALFELGQSYYVLPLQLNSDAQIRDHSAFRNMQQVIEHVLQSFAMHAAFHTQLVIKNHPLDMGLENYAAFIQATSRALGIEGRVDYLESGDLNSLLEHARGLVTVNSTAGGLAVGLGCPTICLSDPIYNLPGLTFHGGLDDFWQHSEPPSMALFSRFRNTVIHASQVNGGFYCKAGNQMAIAPCVQRLTSTFSPLERLLQTFPLPNTRTPVGAQQVLTLG